MGASCGAAGSTSRCKHVTDILLVRQMPSQQCAAKLAARASAMERDLADFVAIPTCSGHEEGLVRFRAIMRARLAALGAEIGEVAGDPKPAWIVQPGQRAGCAKYA